MATVEERLQRLQAQAQANSRPLGPLGMAAQRNAARDRRHDILAAGMAAQQDAAAAYWASLSRVEARTRIPRCRPDLKERGPQGGPA